MHRNGIKFIYSNVFFEEEGLPFKLSETMILRAATSLEIKKLNEHLKKAYGDASRWVVPFDRVPEDIEENGIKKTIYTKTENERWWVVAFNGDGLETFDLEKVSTLISPKLHFGSTFTYSGNQQGRGDGMVYGGHFLIELLTQESRKVPALVSPNELLKMKSLYEFLVSDQAKYENIGFVLELYSSSSNLLRNSALLTLSLFSIIESLIVHKPRLTETLDSITHQIKNKVNLLVKRFDNSVKSHYYFGDIGYPKLWSKLYGLRSDIAHGQKYDFSGQYEILRSLDNVNIFLDNVARELIKLSIEEYDLVSDLREC